MIGGLRVVLAADELSGEAMTVDPATLTDSRTTGRAEILVVDAEDFPLLEPLAARLHLYAGTHAGLNHVLPISAGPPRLGDVSSDLDVAGIVHPDKYRGPHGAVQLRQALRRLLVEESTRAARRGFILGVRPELHRALAQQLGVDPPPRQTSTSDPADDVPIHDLVGSSPRMRELRRQIVRLAKRDDPVLVLGPPGSGKEPVARALHDRSGRRGGFHPVNVASLDRNLVASELFGHQQGAFTGAIGSRKGHFAAAGVGTLFLDEFGELKEPEQVQLLRVLDEGREYTPVGSSRVERFQGRLVAATNRDVRTVLRADLLARFQFRIVTPALFEHREDIPEIAGTLWTRLAPDGPPLPDAVIEVLMAHPWRENVRGLRTALLGLLARDAPPNAALMRSVLLERYELLGSAGVHADPRTERWLRQHEGLRVAVTEAERCLRELRHEDVEAAPLRDRLQMVVERLRASRVEADTLAREVTVGVFDVAALEQALQEAIVTAKEAQQHWLDHGEGPLT